MIRSAFPTLGEPLSGALLRYVGTGDEDDIDFVISALRAYDGAAVILDMCKAIIKTVPERSRVWGEVAAAIETTGVVTGEYGLAQAYERTRQEISAWNNDEDERVLAFAVWLSEGLTVQIEQERKRAEQGSALRKYHYEADKED